MDLRLDDDHRPWPIPGRNWIWRQAWCDLLFAHWPISAERLRPLLPAQLEVDCCEGSAWLGVVPFRMADVTRRPFPVIPWVCLFPELNLRTYVRYQGKPGVWFFSLDAASRMAVWIARRCFHLPYHHARMALSRRDDRVAFRSERSTGGFVFRADYAATGPEFRAEAGSLAHFLTERYCLYAVHPSGELLRTEVHHAAWPLRPAEACIQRNSLWIEGLERQGPPALMHTVDRIDVVAWSPQRLHPK